MIIRDTVDSDVVHAHTLCEWYKISSLERGTGIATRTVAYLQKKISKGDAIIALHGDDLVGFCYIETFDDKQYVSNSGLIVAKNHRGKGIAKLIKKAAFELARKKYPSAKIFGITTSDVVMKINTELGYRPVAFHNLPKDEIFWNGCNSCPNYDILLRNDRKMCLCTGMVAYINSTDNNNSDDKK